MGDKAVKMHDELYDEAKRLVRSTTLPSVTFVQRKLKVDFTRAASILRELEDEGLVGVPTMDELDGPEKQKKSPREPGGH